MKSLIRRGGTGAGRRRRWLFFALLVIACPALNGCTYDLLTEIGFIEISLVSIEEIRRTDDDQIIYRGRLMSRTIDDTGKFARLGVRYLSGPFGTSDILMPLVYGKRASYKVKLLSEESLEELGRDDVYLFPSIEKVSRKSKEWHLYPDDVRDTFFDPPPPAQWKDGQVIYRKHRHDESLSERPIFEFDGKYFQIGRLSKVTGNQSGLLSIRLPGWRYRTLGSTVGVYAILPVVVAVDVALIPVYILGGFAMLFVGSH